MTHNLSIGVPRGCARTCAADQHHQLLVGALPGFIRGLRNKQAHVHLLEDATPLERQSVHFRVCGRVL